MRKILSLLITLSVINTNAQQINGVFTDFAQNKIWDHTVINSAVQESSGYITLGGYYQGSYAIGKVPMILQISAGGIIRSDFGNGSVFLMNFVNSNNRGTMVDKTYIANTSFTANSNQIIVAGREDGGNGFLVKSFPTSSRPTAFNNGQITTLSGGGASANGYIEDWVTGSTMYSVRMNGATFGNARVLLSSFSKETGAPLISFGDSGTLKIHAPEGNIVNPSRPARIIQPEFGAYTDKFYVAFSTIASMGSTGGIALCRVNVNSGTIDSSFGANGYKTFPTASAYYVTSLLANDDESVTVGGYGSEEEQSVPSFCTFKTDDSYTITSFNYLLGQPYPGFGSKNIAAKKAYINDEERIVFAYAHPINTNDQYRIAIASLTPSGGAGTDPLAHTPWLGNGFVSAEPTSIIALSGNDGFIVTGKATRTDGTLAGVVLKYNYSGILDESFGNQGVLIINGRSGGGGMSDVTQMPNGKYLVAGNVYILPAQQQIAMWFNRFNSDGSLDSSFGTNGSVHVYHSTYNRTVSDIQALPDGKFLIGGSYTNYTNEPGIGTGTDGSKATVYKFNADGSPDNSFGPFNNGRYHFPGYIGMTFMGMKQVNGNIYMGGNTAVTTFVGGRTIILKLSAAGINTGTYAAPFRSLHEFIIDSTNEDAYMAGGLNGSPKEISKVKHGSGDQSGSPDSSWGVNGVVSIPMINSNEGAMIRQMKIKPAGLLALVDWSSSYNGSATYAIYFCFISNAGVLDTTFGTGGRKYITIPGATSVRARQFKWTDDGNYLLIFGEATVSGVVRNFVCKADISGNMDARFGTNGVVWAQESFAGNMNFDNDGNMLTIKNYGFYGGVTLAKLQIPADVYISTKSASWTGAINNDWFNAGNWAENIVPDSFTEVVIDNGSVVIGANQHAYAYSVTVSNGADLTLETNSTIDVTSNRQ